MEHISSSAFPVKPRASAAGSRDLHPSFRGIAVGTGAVKAFFVYITASGPRGVLYVGVTSDLPGRTWEHRERVLDGFTKRYWVDRLVYYEFHGSTDTALPRERALKRWRRNWKIQLIEKNNPSWADLYEQAMVEHGYTL